MDLVNKCIWLISPQDWGTMRISKHHYALALAKRGNTVYFFEPPVFRGYFQYKKPSVRPSGIHPSLFIVSSSLRVPYFFKFHCKVFFYYFIRKQIRVFSFGIAKKPDIIWSFDLSDVFPLRYFSKACYRIFHPVDMPLTAVSLAAGQDADIMFSTSSKILEKYSDTGVPSFFIEHGLADEFISPESDRSDRRTNLRVGYSGNLLRHDIHRSLLLSVIRENPAVIFEFWGSFAIYDMSRIARVDDMTRDFISALSAFPNVVLHGSVTTDVLASSLVNMDAFLVCYDPDSLNPIGPNYHKLMEFFSTGKVIVSSYIGHYADRPELIQMTSREESSALPKLFRAVINDLSFYNSSDKMIARQEWAYSNTYSRQISRMETILKC